MMWLGLLIGILSGLALIAVGVFVLRPASKGGGFLLAGAGALELLTVCCVRGTTYLQDSQGVDLGGRDAAIATSAASSCTDVVIVLLIAAAFFAASKQLRPTKPNA